MNERRVYAARTPDPRLVHATILMAQAVLSKEIAENVAEPLKGNILKSAEKTISSIADDYCGVGAHGNRPPNPFPGPRGLDLAIAVATFANIAAKSGSFRDELMKVAGSITKKAYESVEFISK
jgi:hypothetical protein